MWHRTVRSIAASLLCGLLSSTAAFADPIRITGGQLTTSANSAGFTFTGPGLLLTAGVQGGLISPMFNCTPCRPDSPVPLSFDADLPGATLSSGRPGEFEGVSYDRTFLSGSLFFDGLDFNSAVLTPDNLTFTSAFSMTGTLLNYASSPRFDPPLFTASLFGTGTATVSFSAVPDPLYGYLFHAGTITYRFEDPQAPAPTPEPATLLLLGTGLAGLIARRRGVI